MDSHLVAQEIIQNKIRFLRDQKVMVDSDLATLYGVEPPGSKAEFYQVL